MNKYYHKNSHSCSLSRSRRVYLWMSLAIICASSICRSHNTFVRAFAPSAHRGTLRLVFHHPRHRSESTPVISTFHTHSLCRCFATKTDKQVVAKAKKKDNKASRRPYRLVIVESPSKCSTISKTLEQLVKENHLPYDFKVTSCYGHVRNLPKKSLGKKKAVTTSKFPYSIVGIDLDHGYEPTYEIIPGKQEVVTELRSLATEADEILLATDPDREGEAMAWHLTQILPQTTFRRVTFTEITQTAITKAVMQQQQQLNPHLVQAQETRRILDRLAGFTVSPLLWRKIAPGLSAGRVQSVGMALVVRRERERLVFEPTEYVSMYGEFAVGNNFEPIQATLVSVNGQGLASSGKDFTSQGQQLVASSRDKLHLQSNQFCADLLEATRSIKEWKVVSVSSRPRSFRPPKPYRTSTLQQDAVRRLGLSVQQTMRAAQQLYEQGLISYMRTDATFLSDEAEAGIKTTVMARHGEEAYDYAVDDAKDQQKKNHHNSSKNKFAQEAHEAIRPTVQTDGTIVLSQLESSVPEAARSLYELICQRTLASRMAPLKTKQTQIVIQGESEKFGIIEFRASGSVVLSPGYTMEYEPKEHDTDGDDGRGKEMPPLQEGQSLSHQTIESVQHESQPPPRYTEASFVKELEALGVGRPSTYSGIVQLLRDRAYVGSPATVGRAPRRSGKQLVGPAISAVRAAGGEEFTGGTARGPMVPSLSALVVCSLLEKHCPSYVDPDFTARMEERLDVIASRGTIDEESDDSNVAVTVDNEERNTYLDEFYAGDHGLAAQIKRLDDTVPAAEARRALLPALEEISEEIGLFVGPWGPYVQQLSESENSGDAEEKAPTTSLPASLASDLSSITPTVLKALLSSKEDGGALLGEHPKDNRKIRLKTGRFGAYLQWGEDGEEGTTTHTLPRHKATMRVLDIDEDVTSLGSMLKITLEEAVAYVNLPRTVGTLNELPITAAIGPFGPYLLHNGTYTTLYEKDGDVLTIDEETAIHLVTTKPKTARGVLATLGEMEGSAITVKSGRFGSYLNWKRVNAKLPENYKENPADMPLTEAWSLIQEKAAAAPSGRKTSKQKSGGNDGPKRPKSAYLYFCAAKRPQVAETVKSLGAVSKELARLWAETTDRSEYERLARQDKERYQQELSKNGAVSKKPRAPSAYMLFCQEHRPTLVDDDGNKLPFGEITKRLASMWRECDEAKRERYQALAQEKKVALQESQ